MLDARMRQMLSPVLTKAGTKLATTGVPPLALTAAGWAAGAGACAATALHAWPAALGLWLANRLLDGLDGPTAGPRGGQRRPAVSWTSSPISASTRESSSAWPSRSPEPGWPASRC